MENFQDKLYQLQATPPDNIWDNISNHLDEDKVIQMPATRNKMRRLYYGLTAAAAVLIILFSTFLFDNKENSAQVATTHDLRNPSVASSQESLQDSIIENQQLLGSIIKTPESQKVLASNQTINGKKEYITIAGAEGQPVKISPKAATLILSANNEFPPKPVWDKKIDQWQKIMLSNTLTAPSNLMDMMQKLVSIE